jgi:hypothetical protein
MLRRVSTRIAGLIILIAGIWGGLIAFVGPYFHFALGPDQAWRWTSGRLYLDVLPAVAAVVGGLLLLRAGPWLAGRFGAILALAGGIWFAVGPDVSRLWHSGGAQGIAHGRGGTRTLEYLTYHSGLGVLITALAAYALPGALAIRRRVGRDQTAPGALAGADTAPAAGAREGAVAGNGDRASAPAPAPAPRESEPVADEPLAGQREPVADEPSDGLTSRRY